MRERLIIHNINEYFTNLINKLARIHLNTILKKCKIKLFL